jgi:hypothetical protein
VLDTLWKKPLPNKLSHLERVSHRPDNLFFQSSITSLTWRECCTTGQQATRSPVLRGHNNPWGKQTQAFPNWFSNHRMVSRSRLRYRDSTHRLALSDKGCIGFSNLTQALPESTLRLLVQRVYGVYSYRGWVGRTVQ